MAPAQSKESKSKESKPKASPSKDNTITGRSAFLALLDRKSACRERV